MTTLDTLLSAVADAIATADVDGATYEDLALAALDANTNWMRVQRAMLTREMTLNIHQMQENWKACEQEDDGA